MKTEIEFLKLPAIILTGGRKKATVYADMAAGVFPRPVRIGGRGVAWIKNEVQKIYAARVAGKSDDEIRQIVDALYIARRGAL